MKVIGPWKISRSRIFLRSTFSSLLSIGLEANGGWRTRIELFTKGLIGVVSILAVKGVIHRDIKPSNVMVTLHDGHPVPKVIDFGVAKATNQRLTERTLFTSYGQMIGTPAYMSPEQAEMSGLDIDTRSDIYSLGVLLYELLTGSTPFDSRRLRDAGYMEMQRIIREEDPTNARTHAMRASLRRRQGEFDDALKSFEEAIRLGPSNGGYLTSRAYVWAAQGDRERMMQDLDAGARISPNDALVWNNRAWLLATSPNALLRDGKQAVEAAMRACELSKWKHDSCLNSLAAAHAELGEFAKAIQWQTKAIELTPLAKRPKQELRLELFREGKPYRESHTAN